MNATEKQLETTIKSYGYKKTSDKMGVYYTNKDKKFSFIKTGDIYNCYYNKLIDNQYQLQDQLQGQIMLIPCFQWVLNHIKD